MSKTVKRVMTAMMIGLIAMLGTKAEAHTFIKKGKLFVCSTCGDVTLTEVPDPKLHPAIAELVVKTKDVRIKCEKGPPVTLKDTATLVARTLSKNWGYDATSQKAEVKFFALDESDALFAILGFCSLGNPLVDVQILKLSARYKVSECLNPDCSASVLLSTMKLDDCEVALNADINTLYECKKKQKIEHVHPSPRTK